MIKAGRSLGQSLKPPIAIELIGDVGAGKTTLTKGIAKTLGVKEPITSPSFTINKTYAGDKYTLSHYDFYRLADPGIMADELAEAANDKNTITIIEWADTVQSILPKNHLKVTITTNKDGSRTLQISP